MLLGASHVWGAGLEHDAYLKARSLIDEKYQSHVLSLYGKGPAGDVLTWRVLFYDPTSPSKARLVVLNQGKVDRFDSAESSQPYDDRWSFDPLAVTTQLRTAMDAAQQYAKDHQLSYDENNVLLKRSEAGAAPVWRVELRQSGNAIGFVYTSSTGTFARYQAAEKSSGSGARGFANDVEGTFRGIGGDLEEFFTGKRTVDK